MSRPNTFRKEDWLQHEPSRLALFSEGFIHNRLAICKVSQQTPTLGFSYDSFFKLKERRISSSDELRVWLPFREGRTFCGLHRDDAFKLHYDHGIFNHHGYLFNIYGDIRAKRNLDALGGKLGVSTSRNNWKTNFRLAVVNYCSYIQNKTSYAGENWGLEVINSYDIKHREWNTSNIQFTHAWQEWQFILQAAGHTHNSKVRFNRFLTDVNAAIFWSYQQHTFGLRMKGDIRTTQTDEKEVVWEYRASPQSVLKVRADGANNVAVSVKTPIEKWGSWTLGFNVEDFGRANSFSYGLQVEVEL